MKKLYTKKTVANTKSKKLIVFVVFILTGVFNSYSQVQVPFAPRTATATPATTVYDIKGDFTMIGNTNLTLVSYSDNGNNANDMRYVDIDGVSSTFNSSSATLTFSNENGAIPSCSNIIYAGLYWTGRASDNSTDPQIFNVTKNGVTKSFDKRKVLLKGPTAGSYTQVVASSTANLNKNIYFPTGGTDNGMYSAYAEVTDYVRTHGLGEYFVADIALREGSSPSGIGLYGGWGMVVVYENSKMKYRNVTVFDGHAYVRQATTLDYTFTVSGFNAVQSGNVNLKLGLMAGEGDNLYSGDYFQIERRNTGVFESLSHSGNSTNNFFNSSILTGGNARNPNYTNNSGLDIAMFNVNNNPTPLANRYINHNQTSTRFRYGSTIDTYSIFNVTFSVDAYIPEVDGVLSTTSINGVPNPPIQTIAPGQAADYKIEIRNKGTEATNNTLITIPIPSNVNSSNLNIIYNVYSPLTTTNIPVTNPPNITYPYGYITWDLGTLPLPSDPNTVLADISFTLTVTKDCTKLTDPSFDPNVTLNGNISGTGAISSIPFNRPLVQGYQQTGLCVGEPIPTPSLIAIDVLNYVNQPPTASNPTSINVQCKSNVPTNDINVVTDEADNSGIPPIVTFISDVSDGGINPEIITRTYRVTDDCNKFIDVQQIITINDVQLPTITCPTNITQTADNDLCSAIVTINNPTATDNCSTTFTFAGTRSDSLALTDAYPVGTTTITWTATDQANNTSVSCEQTVTITDDQVPTISCPSTVTVTADNGEAFASGVTLGTPTTDDNCAVDSLTNDAPANFPLGNTTVTWTVTDASNNIATCEQIVTVTDEEDPSITCTNSINQNVDIGQCDAVVTYELPTFSDNAPGATIEQTAGLASGSAFPIGTTTNTFVVTDASGNKTTCSFDVTIIDNEIPVIICPTNITQTADSGQCSAIINLTNPTALDNCSTTFTYAGTRSDNLGLSEAYPVGTTTISWTATDDANNTSNVCNQTVIITDNQAPTFVESLPENITVECDQVPVAATLTATDNCISVNVIFNETNTAGSCLSNYTLTRTWTATDTSGNSIKHEQIVTIQDTTPPVITLPANVTAECNDDLTTTALGTATATDNCDANPVVTFIDAIVSGNCGNDYTIIRTWTATDVCGNTFSQNQTITVQDKTAPVITVPSNTSVQCDADVSPNMLGFATATDNCDANPVITFTDDITNGNCAGNYIITRTWTATDVCNNSISQTQVIAVTDTTAPVITIPANISVECSDDLSSTALGTATATDTCDTTPVITFIDAITAGNCSGNYTITRTWTATDACGNASFDNQTITVSDTKAPILDPETPYETNLSVGCEAIPEIPTLKFTDNCTANVTVIFNETSSFDENALTDYEVVRSWTVSDDCNNSDVFTQTLSVSLNEIVYEITAGDRCFDDGVVDLNQFISNGNISGVWELLEGKTQATLSGNIFNPTTLEFAEDFLPGDGGIDYLFRYTVVENECISITEVTMNIHADCVVLPCGSEDVTISKAITPNGDLINDTFDISGIELCGFKANVKIFNRWGALVYESDNYDIAKKGGDIWDGSANRSSIGNANKVPNGTYYYIITLKDSGLAPFTGPVYLGTK